MKPSKDMTRDSSDEKFLSKQRNESFAPNNYSKESFHCQSALESRIADKDKLGKILFQSKSM